MLFHASASVNCGGPDIGDHEGSCNAPYCAASALLPMEKSGVCLGCVDADGDQEGSINAPYCAASALLPMEKSGLLGAGVDADGDQEGSIMPDKSLAACALGTEKLGLLGAGVDADGDQEGSINEPYCAASALLPMEKSGLCLGALNPACGLMDARDLCTASATVLEGVVGRFTFMVWSYSPVRIPMIMSSKVVME